MFDLTTPHRFGGFAFFRLLRNTKIKGTFAYRSLLIRKREAKETKTRGKGEGK